MPVRHADQRGTGRRVFGHRRPDIAHDRMLSTALGPARRVRRREVLCSRRLAELEALARQGGAEARRASKVESGHHDPMRKLVAPIVAAALIACGCSSVTFGHGSLATDGSTNTRAPSVGAPTPPNTPGSLSSQLLQPSDLPGDWQPYDGPTPTPTDPKTASCILNHLASMEAHVEVQTSDRSLVLGEILAQLTSDNGAEATFTATRAVFDRCGAPFHLLNPDGTPDPTIARLVPESLPTVGDQSRAWLIVLDNAPPGIGSFGVILIARRGREVALLILLDPGVPGVLGILRYAQIAIAKMPR